MSRRGLGKVFRHIGKLQPNVRRRPMTAGWFPCSGDPMMQSWNAALFLSLNPASRPGAGWLGLVELVADAPLLLAPALLAALWIWGLPARRPALIATGAGLFAGQAINLLLGLAWFEPRPFMVGLGHTWLAHVADNGFPSDHATLAWSLGLGLALTGAAVGWGVAACLVGLLTGWARVYLGVHFPLDVLASAPAGLLAACVAVAALPLVRRWAAPPVEHVYGAVLASLPPWLRAAAGAPGGGFIGGARD